MRVLVIDTETARGVDFASIRGRLWTAPGWRKCGLAQVAWAIVDLDETLVEGVSSAYIADASEEVDNPYARVTQELCDEFGQAPERVAADLGRVLETVDAVGGHNVAFDIGVLSSWLAAKGAPEVGERLRALPSICTMREAATQVPAAGGRWPKLVALCEMLGVPVREAHDARDDVLMTADCLLALRSA